MSLDHKVAIVTGAASGIGASASERLASAGADVILADVRVGPVRQVAAELRARGLSASAAEVDVANERSVTALFGEVMAGHGRIDVLVNSAGIELTRMAGETSLEEWQRVIGVNLTGTFLCCREAIRHMSDVGECTIVNVASQLAFVGTSEHAAYCASKGGVLQLTKSIAVDYSSKGIRANCVCPGPVDTELLRGSIRHARRPIEEERSLVEGTLCQRLGRPEEIAEVILFLASPESSYVIGSALLVDGGTTAR